MAYTFQTTTSIGASPVTQVDDAARHVLGTIFPASDPVFGGGEFIYLKGAASTAAGDVIDYDLLAGTTTRTPATGGNGPVAIAVAAIVANKFGWYQIAGIATVNAPTVAAVGDCYVSAIATLDEGAVSGEAILGAEFVTITNGGTPAAGASKAYIQFNRPTHGATTP